MPPSFVHPEWIASVTVGWLVIAATVLLSSFRARRRASSLLGAPPSFAHALRRDGMLLFALLAVGLALLGPRLGTRTESIPASGVDVVLLLDVSRSMDARDVPPSRLDRARRTASELLVGLAAGDRAALAVFGSRGVLLTPLTHDPDALLQLLPALDTSLVQPAGSRLGRGVREALMAFDPASERARVLVVLSDGEDPDGSADAGSAEAMRENTRVVAVAFGTERGAAIPSQGLELRDRRGRVVLSRRDSGRLAALAAATDGVFLQADDFGAVDPRPLRAAVRRDAGRGGAGAGEEEARIQRQVPAVRIVPLALLALAVLVLETLRLHLPGRRRGLSATASAVLLLATPGAGGEEQTTGTHLARGTALADAGQWQAAERAFRAAALSSLDPAVAAGAYYDSGVAALEAGRLEAARDAFLEAVALRPGDTESRFNLEWTLRALSAQEPPPRPPRPGAADEMGERPEPDATAPSQAPLPPLPSQPKATGSSPVAPPELDPAEVERLLARAVDHPESALRSFEHPEDRSRISPW